MLWGKGLFFQSLICSILNITTLIMKRMQNRMPTKSPNSNSLSDSGLVTCADQFSLASLLLVWLFSERWRIDAFELWCWRRLLTVPWTARRSNQSILNEISPGCSLEGMMLKLKLQYFGHLMRRVNSLEKTDAGRDWGQEEKETTEDEMAGWHHRLDGREFEWTPGIGDGQGGLACCYSWGRKESDTTEQLNWTELNWTDILGL